MLLLGVTAALALAQGQRKSNDILTGQSWHDEWTLEFRTAYVMGFIHGYQNVTVSLLGTAQGAAIPVAVKTSMCFDRMTIGQHVAVMDKYLADHPEEWDKPIYLLLLEATKKTCDARGPR